LPLRASQLSANQSVPALLHLAASAMLTQDDWDWLQKLARISRRWDQAIPLDVLLRLVDIGYARDDNRGHIVITSLGRQTLKAREGGEEY